MASVNTYELVRPVVPGSAPVAASRSSDSVHATIFDVRALASVLLALGFATVLTAAGNLEIYAIDVEGGQATLFVTPAGESLLVDTGWPRADHRDAERIAAAAKAGGVRKIDYLLITHYHNDHVGGVQGLARKLPIVHFVDHGAQTETGKDAEILFNEYSAFRNKGQHIVAKPGDTIPIKGMDVKVLSAAGQVIAAPLAGAGETNPACEGYQRPPADTTENGQSVGVLITFGEFRMVDMGDLTKDHEYDLVCPMNKIGRVDLYLVSHHGMPMSGSPAFVRGLDPHVAIVDNGPHKGGDAATWQTIRDTRGVLDIWQLHYAMDADKQHNAPDTFIANIDEKCEAKWIQVSVQKDGTFVVENSRNRFKKTYTKK
jgi:beta-lactamase superfamily II metal-dependent hydrolase